MLEFKKNYDKSMNMRKCKETTLALFEAYGIELEYMIVDFMDILAYSPIADLLLEEMAGDGWQILKCI